MPLTFRIRSVTSGGSIILFLPISLTGDSMSLVALGCSPLPFRAQQCPLRSLGPSTHSFRQLHRLKVLSRHLHTILYLFRPAGRLVLARNQRHANSLSRSEYRVPSPLAQILTSRMRTMTMAS